MENKDKVNEIIKYYNCDADAFSEMFKVALGRYLNKEVFLFKDDDCEDIEYSDAESYLIYYGFWYKFENNVCAIGGLKFDTDECYNVIELYKVMTEAIDTLYLGILREQKINCILDDE